MYRQVSIQTPGSDALILEKDVGLKVLSHMDKRFSKPM